jgi:hypothetical protein
VAEPRSRLSASKQKATARNPLKIPNRDHEDADDELDKEPSVDELEIIDLADTEEIPEELRIPKKDNRTKLSAFQCVICMDDVSGLTVTHCGKLLFVMSHLLSYPTAA